MSTFAPTLDFDEAFNGSVMFHKSYIDGYGLNLGVMNAAKKAWGSKMGQDWSGAQVEVIRMAVRKHSTPTGFQTGNETFNLNVQSTDEGIQFRMGTVGYPIGVNLAEAMACGSQAGLNEFLQRRVEMVRKNAERELAQHIVAGGVTAYENCVPVVGSMFSLNGIDHATYGFIEHRAFGSQTNVIGGFSKATWASRPQTQNTVMDVSSSFSSNGLAQMFALTTRLAKYAQYGGNEPYYGLMTEAAFNNYKRAVQTNERFVSEKDVNGGWVPMAYGNILLQVEEYLPISTTYGGSTSASNKASMFVFHPKAVYPKWAPAMSLTLNGEGEKIPEGRFGLSRARRLPTNWAFAAEMRVGLNMWVERFASLGVLLNAETW